MQLNGQNLNRENLGDYTADFAASENILAGAVGAFLFSLIGGALYFIIYQIGYIAGISGLVIYVLSAFGYQLFTGKKNSIKGIITAGIVSVIMILFAEYLCLSFEIYQIFKAEYQINIFDAIASTPSFLAESEVLIEVLKDVAFALAFGGLAAFSTIRNAVKASKADAQPAEAFEQVQDTDTAEETFTE